MSAEGERLEIRDPSKKSAYARQSKKKASMDGLNTLFQFKKQNP